MDRNEPLPLWKEAIPDREPWRRGRIAVALISALVVIGQALGLTAALLRGDIAGLLAWACGGALVCLLLFLIWIGQNWARWIVAPLFGVSGFTALVWAVVYSNVRSYNAGLLFLCGIVSITIFSYLALSPAVYAFARRQREKVTLLESLVVGGALLLVLGSVASALLAFHIYKSSLEEEAGEFAQLAFRRVFQNHDAGFLEAHSSAGRKNSQAASFIALAEERLGRFEEAGGMSAVSRAQVSGRRIALNGRFDVRAKFESGPAWVHIQIVGTEGQWTVEHIWWDY